MPLNELLSAIESEAREERERLEAESRAEVEAIVAAAHGEAARAREDILRAYAPDTQAAATRRVASARLEAARLRRAAREEAFSLLLQEARSRLAAQARGGDRATTRALLLEALAALPDAEVLWVNPRDEESAVELVRELHASLTVETADVTGGVVLETGHGVVVRNTFEERLANAESELRPWYGRRLDRLAAATSHSESR